MLREKSVDLLQIGLVGSGREYSRKQVLNEGVEDEDVERKERRRTGGVLFT